MNNKRIKTLLIGLLVVGLITCIGVVLFVVLPRGRAETTSEKSESQPQYYLNDFQQIQGTPILVAEITLNYNLRSEIGISRWFSFSVSETARAHNLVFLNSDTLESHKLFPINEQGILNVTQFPKPYSYAYEAVPTMDENAKTEWLVYEIVVSDSNGDGLLNRDDPLVLAISDANGYAYTELLNQVDAIYGMEMVEPGKLVISYLRDGKRLSSIVDADNKVILETKELVDLGEDVQ